MRYRLSEQAKNDLGDILLAGSLEFGLDRAERYHDGLEQAFTFLAQYPRAARERLELKPPVRVYTYRAHVVIYVIEPNDIRILRIRRASEDWQAEPV